ncbi:MAG: hypothetical protein KME32_09885 [Mojavia pulchra JT2-VF2]|jgi:hypothetical protein|uniref:Uncharacterized protein n=1 Tax=Mojavia pulchra JT2-VF2 TaxID=287848 RepID=A0A951PW87_9NOST|nr:hypothetical protein [Mojavia pulchra JT2-VF2]
MTSPSDREIYHSENRQESYTDANGDTHIKRTTETVNSSTSNSNSYGSGYVQGRNTERSYQQANLAERDNSNTANGLLLGVILTSLVSLLVGALWYFNQGNNEAVDNAVPLVVPVPTNASPSPTPTQSPQPQTTIIERTKEIPIPIPQQVPSVSAPSQPNINITLPPQRPTSEKTSSPSQANPSPQNSTSNTPTQQNKGDTSVNSPIQGLDQPNSTTSNGSTAPEDADTGASVQ